MASEVELKFALTPEVGTDFEASHWWSELRDSGKTEILGSVYFDTRKHKLHERGISLRVRRIEDKRVQTLKRPTTAAFTRSESEAELEADRPDLSRVPRSTLGPLRAKRLERKLLPIFETRFARTTVPVHSNGGQVEIAVDHGTIVANGCTVALYEVEFELKSGDAQSIVRLASRMLEEVPARYCLLSKAERGYALAAHERMAPVRAQPVELDRNATVADAFRVIAHACLRHFALNERGVLEHDTESVHQMRVGLRRLRAALSVFKRLLVDPESQHIKEELRWLTEQLGRARDYDVFINGNQGLRREGELHAEPVGELEALLRQRLSDGLAQAEAAVASDRFRRIVASTALWIAGGNWLASTDEQGRAAREVPMRKFASRMLRARTRKIRKKLARLDQLDEHQRHRLRIGVKKLHYATEFVESLFPKSRPERKRFTRVLKRLQDALGELNDTVVHGRILSDLVNANSETSDCATRSRVAHAAGLVLGHEERELQMLLAKARSESRRLARLKPFWR